MKTAFSRVAPRVVAALGWVYWCAGLVAASPQAGFETIDLFNGRDLTGWKGDPRFWSVEDHAITGRSTAENPVPHNTFLVWQGGEVRDFVLHFQCRIKPGDARGFGNSGVQYRSRLLDPKEFVMGGYQADMEVGPRYTGILYEERGRGILAQRGQKVRIHADGRREVVGSLGRSEEIQAVIRPGDWNDYTIIVRGNRLAHLINGRLAVAVLDEQTEKGASHGLLGLQLHAGPPMEVQFRNLRLTRLAPERHVVFIAGRGSHGRGAHEHWGGLRLLQQCLEKVPGLRVTLHSDWPKDPLVLETADAIVIYSDGGGGHPALQGQRLEALRRAVERGAGLACLHYAVEVPKERAGAEWLAWLGGYFETDWSVNPTWTAKFESLPEHEVTRGVRPFRILDEWYYHMRFQPKGVVPILADLPPASTLRRPDGPHSNNPHVRAAVLERKEPQVVMWLYVRPDQSRAFGFTGGHFHRNWGQDDFRKVVLNAIVWLAGLEVPANGVESTVTPEALEAVLDR